MVSKSTYNFRYENLEYFDESIKLAIAPIKELAGDHLVEDKKFILMKNEKEVFRIGVLARIFLQKNGKDVTDDFSKSNISFKEKDVKPIESTGVFSLVTSHSPSEEFKSLEEGSLDYISTNTFLKKMLSEKLCENNTLIYEIPYTIMDQSEEMLVSDDSEGEGAKKKVFVTKSETGVLKQEIYLKDKQLTIIKNGCVLLENYNLSKYVV